LPPLPTRRSSDLVSSVSSPGDNRADGSALRSHRNGISSGSSVFVRNDHHGVSRTRYDPCWFPYPLTAYALQHTAPPSLAQGVALGSGRHRCHSIRRPFPHVCSAAPVL